MSNIVKICYYNGKVIIPYNENIIIISVAYAGIVSELVPAYYVISLFIIHSNIHIRFGSPWFFCRTCFIRCGIQLSSLCYFKVHAIWPRVLTSTSILYLYLYTTEASHMTHHKAVQQVAMIMFSILQFWLSFIS